MIIKLLKLLKYIFVDTLEHYKYYFPGQLKNSKRYNLDEEHVYPTGKNIDKLFEIHVKNDLRIFNEDSLRYASIGTCFAEEFSKYISTQHKYLEYIKTEDNVFYASANWGRVYTLPNLQQIIEYSLTNKHNVLIEQSKTKGFFDPFREYSVGYKKNPNEASASILKHREASRYVFLNAQILVITIGQNEGWVDNIEKIVWGTAPFSYNFNDENTNRFTYTEFSFSKNISCLDEIINTLTKCNPKIKIILTVSPVAAEATFTQNNIITQSFAGKCTLRAVVHEIIKKYEGSVYYFPSFEMVFCKNQSSFRSDNRHVKRMKVRSIFKVFDKVLKDK